MKRLLSCLVAAAFELAIAAPSVRACDTVQTSTPESRCVVVEHEGRRGVWFDLKTADELRRYKLEVPELRLQVEGYEQLSSIRESQVDAYLDVIALKDSAIRTAEENLEKFVRQARTSREEARKAREALHAWHRNPALWAAVGALVVAGGLVAVDKATD